jgi:hypothetical protein
MSSTSPTKLKVRSTSFSVIRVKFTKIQLIGKLIDKCIKKKVLREKNKRRGSEGHIGLHNSTSIDIVT